MKNKNKGFTLIELLVVIAVIGILAAVILAALSQARERGKVSTVQQELSSLRSQAEIVYGSGGGSYANFCTDTKVVSAVTDAAAQFLPTTETIHTGAAIQSTTLANRRAVCRSTATQWAVSIPTSMNSAGDTVTGFWCVDSNGASKVQVAASPLPNTSVGTAAYVCP